MPHRFRYLMNFIREVDSGIAVMRGEAQSAAWEEAGQPGELRTFQEGEVRRPLRDLKRLGRRLHPRGGPRLAVFALLLAMTLWGSVFVATKEVMSEAGPFTVAAGRFAIGLAVLLPLARREGFTIKLAVSRTYLLFGFTGVFLAYGLQNLALMFTSAGNASLVVATQPAAVVLMGVLFLREQLQPARLIGIGLAMAGVLLVSAVAFSSGGADALLGNALMAGAVLAYGAYAAQGRVLGANHPPSLTTAAGFAAGLMFMSPFVAGEMFLYGLPELSAGEWLVLLYLGVSTTAATFMLWNYALRYLEAGAAGLYFSLVPVAGLGFAVLFGGRVGIMELAGGALAIAGVLLGDYLVRRRMPVYQSTET